MLLGFRPQGEEVGVLGFYGAGEGSGGVEVGGEGGVGRVE